MLRRAGFTLVTRKLPVVQICLVWLSSFGLTFRAFTSLSGKSTYKVSYDFFHF